MHPGVLDRLEMRWLLAAPQIADNVGQVILSQFQPYGFKTTVGAQLQGVTLRGSIKVDVVTNSTSADTGQFSLDQIMNSGLVASSQFNGGGFGDIGMQWSRVRVKGRAGTATNTLFIKPQQDNYGPITGKDRVFSQKEHGVAS